MSLHDRILARSAALRKLDRITAGVAVSAFGSVGLLGALGALTVPGTSPSAAAPITCASTITVSGAPHSEDSTSDDSGSVSTSVQASSCTVSSSTGTAVAVTGGSHAVKP